MKSVVPRQLFTIANLNSGVAFNAGEKQHGAVGATASTIGSFSRRIRR
jgi:hypothetical protein